ncbi:Peptidase S54 [Macleaya cordata]|uniref:RHOMBOID-like protein n=1 Tax=Macleaya cordata TaxID=56857 RepID=A0A200QUK3_MACCD|nr:Peptidase S54 [Macleaya cordata]
MASEDLERGGAKNRGNNSYPPSYNTSSSSYYHDNSERGWTSWLIPMFVVANVVMFIVTMYINDCPKNRLPSEGKCVARSLGRFSFQPLRENPLFGPSSATLLKLGALAWNAVVHGHQGWRLVSCIWLHAGIIHLLANMLSLVFIGIRLEQQFGFIRIGIIYLLSGFGGSILSTLFIRSNISVGASGALFGLLGAMLSELLTNWTIYTNKAAALFTLIFIIAINLAVGILPHVDNFAHIGGFLTGFLLGFVLLLRPQFGWMERQNLPVDVRVKSKHKVYQYVLCVLAVVLLIVGFTVGLVMLFRGSAGVLFCFNLDEMGGDKGTALAIGVALMWWWVTAAVVEVVMVGGEIECSTVTALVATCSNFITYGVPDPTPGTPCCDALMSLENMANDSSDNRRSVCRCIMGLVTTYNPNATAIATLPAYYEKSKVRTK